eukprot:TRINITY_DN1041_c0_g1_i1.p1 TRINITY_DN1041_c0_g1~~TRINITY_DN1041_c0_g1_i1.p1  ORF type:complete len:570 (-),score=182.48 TRINITY_DN1041_c0_g1_i1:118-1827(-)
MFQQTPFSTEKEGFAEFDKIFKSKTGSSWSEKKSDGTYGRTGTRKYRVFKFAEPTARREEDVLEKEWDLKKSPRSELPEVIFKLMKGISDYNKYKEGVDSNWQLKQLIIKPHQVPRDQLDKARAILNDLSELYEEQKSKRAERSDPELKVLSMEKIIELSSRFFEIFPQRKFFDGPARPLYDHDVSNWTAILDQLIQLEFIRKLFLGSLKHLKETHPYDYIFRCLNIRMMSLPTDHPEFRAISSYAGPQGKSHSKIVKQVFAVERKGEAEQFQPKLSWSRMLLFYPVKENTLLPTLFEGFKTGVNEEGDDLSSRQDAFYDTLDEVLNQTGSSRHYYHRLHYYNGGASSDSEGTQVLLFEVALGKTQIIQFGEKIPKNIKRGFTSTKLSGNTGPSLSKCLIMNNGCMIPLGSIQKYDEPKEEKKSKKKKGAKKSKKKKGKGRRRKESSDDEDEEDEEEEDEEEDEDEDEDDKKKKQKKKKAPKKKVSDEDSDEDEDEDVIGDGDRDVEEKEENEEGDEEDEEDNLDVNDEGSDGKFFSKYIIKDPSQVRLRYILQLSDPISAKTAMEEEE